MNFEAGGLHYFAAMGTLLELSERFSLGGQTRLF